MKLLNDVLVYLISTYGLEVIDDREGRPMLYWSLYTQGSGVTFSANIADYAPLVKRMHDRGDLDKAAHVKALIDKAELQFKVRYDGSRYTHSQTMDVEVEGPADDVSPQTIAAIECFREAVVELKDAASKEAESLLEDLFMLNVDESEQYRTIETARYRVTMTRKRVQDGDLVETVFADDVEEDLETLRRITKTYREYTAFIPSIRVTTLTPGGEELMSLVEHDGPVYVGTAAFAPIRQAFTESLADAVAEAREYLNQVRSMFREAA